MGDPGDIAMGHSYVFAKEKVRLWAEEEGIRAISLVCTHLGCTVRETPSGFQCPCHGARFDKGGLVLKGPARFPLRHLALSLTADGSLLVHPSTLVTPETFLALGWGLNTTAFPADTMAIVLLMIVAVGLVVGVMAPITPKGAYSVTVRP